MIEVCEQTYRQGRDGSLIRPFSTRAEVSCRGYSGGLQRVLVGFGSEVSFDDAVSQVREHYGIEVPKSAVRVQTLEHGQEMAAAAKPLLTELGPQAGVARLIAEIDGCMVPIVLPGVDADGKQQEDRRKSRQLSWQEARLCLAREPEKVTPRYGACLGDFEQAGAMWADCVIKAGAGAKTQLHCLGDGARWIAGQVKERFGAQATYLCEFYHVSDYVAAAGEAIAGAQATAWRQDQQAKLKENRLEEVLSELHLHLELTTVAEDEAPVRR